MTPQVMVTNWIKARALRALNLGTAGIPVVTADRVRLANAVSLTLTAVAAAFTLQYVVVTPHAGVALLQLGFAVLHGLGLLWTALRRFEFARLWICSAFLVDAAFFATVIMPPASGAGFVLMLTPVFAILIYEPDRQLPKYGATVITMAAYGLTLSGVGGEPWLPMTPYEATITNYANFASGLVGLMVCAHLMSFDRLRTEGNLSRLAATDPLTGLWNRRAVVEQGERLVRERLAAGGALSLVMLDIDHFKAINDQYGHKTGDRVICGVGDILVDNLRRSDVVGRYGGEEFVVVLPGATATGARRVAENVRQRIAASPIEADGVRMPACTVSLGIATLSRTTATMEELVEKADAALYAAKRSGRDRVAVTPPVAV